MENTKRVIEPSDSSVNLVFASDQRYLPYTAVTLSSILKHYTGSLPVRVFMLLDQPMTAADVEKFDSLRTIHPYSINQIVVDASAFRSIRTSEGISIATYYRLLMHEILPGDVHKVIYLDSDLIIRRSIDELFEISFDGNLFAGVEDSTSKDYNWKFGVPPGGRHINAGVMLVNLDLMRSINFTRKVMEHLDVNRYRVTLGDQQIIGELFSDLIKYVPVKWNVHGSMFEPDWIPRFVGTRNCMDTAEAAQAIEEPGIIHYTLKRKPWMSMEHPKSSLWFEYLALTPYSTVIEMPPAPAREVTKVSKPPKKLTFARFFGVILPGYALSIWRLRQTRLQLMELSKSKTPTRKSNPVTNLGGIPSGSKPAGSPQPRKSDLGIKLKQILLDRASRAPVHWSAREAVSSLPEHSTILSNVSRKDADGGYAENIKLLMRTPKIQYSPNDYCDAVVLLSQRIEQGMFWDCIETAYLYDKPLFFAEVALFGGFASFFDKEADLYERRALGFMLDDLGFYFDSRQPSRLERTLNDQTFSLTEEQRERSAALIARIIQNNYTKYNKYVGYEGYDIEDGAVLVVDQKRGDASIEFSGAGDEDFHRMILAAAKENPTRTVYFKRHPDSILGHGKTFDLPNLPNVLVLPDEVSISSIIGRAGKVYTISSQVGFEALLRGKEVVTFGQPFYSGWGITDDRNPQRRRVAQRSIEDIFHVACIHLSIYANPWTGKLIEMEEMFDLIDGMRSRFPAHVKGMVAAE